MAYTSYTPYEWKNAPDHKTTPMSADNLNHMEGGIADSYKFDNTGTDLSSTNKEDAIKEVNAKTSGLTRMTKLWENPSPTASFAAQTITLNSADYDELMYICAQTTSSSVQISGISDESNPAFVQVMGSNGNVYGFLRRMFTPQSNKTQVLISDTTFFPLNDGALSTYNAGCIPIVIYGIKII